MKGRAISYTAAEMAWLERNRAMVISDYHRAFVATFARADVSLVNLHSLRKRKAMRNSRVSILQRGLR
jgi:metallophosphoesterase superfamily enzyme